MIPSICRWVVYTLTEGNVEHINRRRADARMNLSTHIKNSNGVQLHVGNEVEVGQKYPMLITRVWSSPEQVHDGVAVQGQVFLDGNDNLWVTSVVQGDNEGQWHQPPRV